MIEDYGIIWTPGIGHPPARDSRGCDSDAGKAHLEPRPSRLPVVQLPVFAKDASLGRTRRKNRT